MSESSNGIAVSDISFIQPIPLKHMEPHGLLPSTSEAAALWMFLTCAMQALDRVEKQTTLEGNEDQQADLMQIAHSVRNIYELTTLEGMFSETLIQRARAEAFRSALFWDPRINAWFSSGGKSFNNMDRDADKVGQ